jgi:hypothetical protein
MSRLHDAFDDIVATVPVYGDLDRAIEEVASRRRRSYGAAAGLAAAGAAAAVVVGLFTGSPDGSEAPEPIGPVPTPATPPDWRGGLRDDQERLPVVPMNQGRLDPADAEVGAVDIRRITASGRPSWRLVMEAASPSARTLARNGRAMELGVVVDGNGDRLADCHLLISTHAPRPGDLQVRVTDLDSDVTSEQVGPPYGRPFDFFHPAEGLEVPDDFPETARTIRLFGNGKALTCEPFGSNAAFYVYSVLLEEGRPTSVDYAPDNAWLEMP